MNYDDKQIMLMIFFVHEKNNNQYNSFTFSSPKNALNILIYSFYSLIIIYKHPMENFKIPESKKSVVQELRALLNDSECIRELDDPVIHFR